MNRAPRAGRQISRNPAGRSRNCSGWLIPQQIRERAGTRPFPIRRGWIVGFGPSAAAWEVPPVAQGSPTLRLRRRRDQYCHRWQGRVTKPNVANGQRPEASRHRAGIGTGGGFSHDFSGLRFTAVVWPLRTDLTGVPQADQRREFSTQPAITGEVYGQDAERAGVVVRTTKRQRPTAFANPSQRAKT